MIVVDDVQLARDLVPGDVLAGVVRRARRASRRLVVPELDDGGDPLTPPLVGDADDVQSNTAGCALSACSTSSGKIFSPPELIETNPGPSIVIVTGAAPTAESPEMT